MIKSIYDFEKRIAELKEENEHTYKGTLEDYLRNILSQTHIQKNNPCSFDFICNILEKSFKSRAIEFSQDWLKYNEPIDLDSVENNYENFLKTICFQIADLKKLKDSGRLDFQNKYNAIESPTGYTWYNFDVFNYLECGIIGLVDHFEVGNFSDEDIGWDVFIGLLESGRLYE